MDVDVPNPFTQKELNDLVRDLGLSKSSSELLASRLRGKILPRVFESVFTATDIKNSFSFSAWRKIWCIVLTLRCFYVILDYQSIKQMIGGYLLTAANAH